jgi:hypothetical protein
VLYCQVVDKLFFHGSGVLYMSWLVAACMERLRLRGKCCLAVGSTENIFTLNSFDVAGVAYPLVV